MAASRAILAASVLDCDLSNLARESRRALKSGADRLHLDVMDGHFVPSISFGPTIIKRLRRVGKQPFDAHLMIAEPGRYIDQFIDAGCDSITFHVEVEEPIEPTLLKIRKAGRAAGLAIRPKTPLSALEPYRDLLDIVMVMTVEPGFGGQKFMTDASAKILPARDIFRDRLYGGEVHVDGGVNRDNAEHCGGLGADVLVVGSALWKKSTDMVREIRLVKSLADEGYRLQLNDGKPPIPRDRVARFACLPKEIGKRLAAEIEAAGVPVVRLREKGPLGGGRQREYDLLIPMSAREAVLKRFGEARESALAEATAWRRERQQTTRRGVKA
jgi:ribulose-phosphate 3-epimerase